MSHNNKRRNRENQSGPPTLADIVRQETDNGRTIVRFYLDVASGKLDDEGFEVCHRLEAAEQVHAIAPGLVSEYIAQLTGLECNHAILRKRTRDTTRRSRDDTTVIPVATGTHPRSDADCANSTRARHEALEYLASALATPSLAHDPRVAGIVHGSTDHGKTVVSFLMHVMHGVVRGFRPRQRVDAASELLGHIARDELARSGSLPVEPALSAAEGSSPAASSSSPTAESSFPPDGSSFPRKREPIPGPANAGDPRTPDAAGPSFPRRREPIPGPADTDDPHTADAAESSSPTAEPSSPTTESSFPTAESSFPAVESSFPRRACPVLDTGREPIPGPAPADTDDLDDTNTDPHRGCYDIDRKIAEAQHDPSHPIHKFVQAYDEVAAAFHGKDKENDEDDEVRYWISGEVPDAYGKYIWEYAPAYPRSIRRKLRPKRRRSREPGTTPKAESVWIKRPFDKMREAGIPRPSRFKIWV